MANWYRVLLTRLSPGMAQLITREEVGIGCFVDRLMTKQMPLIESINSGSVIGSVLPPQVRPQTQTQRSPS